MKVETVDVPIDHYIDGKRVAGSAGFEVRTPIDNSVLEHALRPIRIWSIARWGRPGSRFIPGLKRAQ